MTSETIIFTQDCCPKCVEAKKKLTQAGIKYTEINVDTVDGRAEFAMNISKTNTTPAFLFRGVEYSKVEDILEVTGKR